MMRASALSNQDAPGFGDNFQTFKSYGTGPSQFGYLYGMAVDSARNKLYVADMGNHRIDEMDSGGGGTTFGANFQTFGGMGSGTGQFNSPHGIAVDGVNNKLYIIDYLNNNIVSMDSGGGGTTFGNDFQTFGSDQLSYPQGIALDRIHNKLYTYDSANYRMVSIDSGSGGTTLGNDFQTFGSGQFGSPQGMDVDSVNNKLYIADYYGDRIDEIDSGGGGTTFGDNFQTFGSHGSGTNQFIYPRGAAFDSAHSQLYITDSWNNRIAKLDLGPDGNSIIFANNFQTFGSQGSGTDQFSNPSGIVVDGVNNRLYIYDLSNNRIVSVDSASALVPTAPSIYGGSDGSISGVNTAMEWKPYNTDSYTAVTGTTISNLSSGTYEVRYAAKAGYNASPDKEVVVPDGPIADQSAPTGLTSAAPSTYGGSDGSIFGVDDTMEWISTGSTYFNTVTGTTITGLSAGAYGVRYAARTGYNASPITRVDVLWGQNAPIGLFSTAPSTYGGSDGSISGVDTTMEWKLSGADTYAAATGTTITGLSAGTYEVRYAAKTGYGASPDTEVVVSDGAISYYTVTFDKNGGDTDASPTSRTGIISGGTTTLPTAPTKTGYAFVGWNTRANGSSTTFTGSTTVTANLTVYAQWTISPTYTVTFDSQGGSSVSAMTGITSGATVSLPTPPNKTGYTFAGWNTKLDGTGSTFNASTEITDNIIVYAHWTNSPSNTPGGSDNSNIPNENNNSNEVQQAKIDSWSAYQSTDINKINCPQRLKLVINGKHFDKDAKIRISEREASSVDVNSSHKIVAKFCLAKLLAHQADRQRTISVQNPDTSREKADKQIDLDSFRKASTPESSNIESNSSNDTSSNNLSASSSSAPLSTEKQNSPGNPIQKTSSQQSNNNDTGNLTPNACSYAIQSGDTLWSIAKKIYGDATAYQEIIDNNKDQYPNIASKLSIGQQLTFGCDNNSNKNIANSNQNSASQAQPQPQQPKHHFSWWNPLTWF
jgi:uncharacterized repeat protein (TIGR02543 family)